jgi:Mn2+/Fe2+ NRAMP family transporter
MADSEISGGDGAEPPGEERRTLFQILGPGLITGASDDDPSGIATYSQAGAQFSFDTAWLLIFSWPLMCAIQEISARIGRVTGRGIGGNLAAHYPKSVFGVIILLLLTANTINLGADLGAMAAGLKLVIGGPQLLYVAAFGTISALLQVLVRYARYIFFLKWLSLALLAYVGVAIVVHVPWPTVVRHIVMPRIKWSRDYLTVVVATLGTTISPYLFFWQAEEEVEDVRQSDEAEPLRRAPRQARPEFERIRLDTYIGMALSNIVALFIVITCATTLAAHGVANIQTSAQAAQALKPIAGPAVFLVFALGIVGTGFLAVPVLAGSAAYAMGEALGWTVGLARSPRRAREFYLTIAVATLIGVILNFTPIDPIKALFWSAVINGVVAAPVMAMMMLMAVRPKIMGRFILPWPLAALGWISTAAMAAAAVGMFATLGH